MFPSRYFLDRYFALRYWPKVGADSVAADGDEVTTANAYFARAVTEASGVFARAVTGASGAFARAVTTQDSER